MSNSFDFVQKSSLDQLIYRASSGVLNNQSNNSVSGGLINQNRKSKSDQQITNNNIIIYQLRGGGCGQTKQPQKVEEKVILNVPYNFLTILEKNVNIINSKAALLLDTQQRNEVIISIQWFIYNREHLNTCCKSENITSSIYTNILNYFQSFLKILPVYLRSSWFLCYQILQICNDFLRIIYTFQVQNDERQMELTLQQELLQDLDEFKNQFEIEQATLWKTGIEYEITLIKIMLMNCQTNSEEGKTLLINIVKNLAQSAFQLSPTEELIPSLIEGAKFLFLQYKDKVLYPEEVYATYYLFQTIKWSIVRLLKQYSSVNNQIKQLKEAFQQYILNSDNWIIHFSWIQLIIDLLAYRPIIDKLEIFKNQPIEQQQVWTSLIDSNLIHSLSFNRNCASIVLFPNQMKYLTKQTKDIIEQQGTFKFKLLSEFLLKGQLTQQINLWDFYKEFSFQKKKDTVINDYEIVLANNNLLILEKEIELFNFQLEEIVNTQLQIQDSLINYFSQSNNSQLDIKLLQDDQTVLIKQLIETYKLAIYHLNVIIELSTIDFEKLQLLSPCLEQFPQETQNSITSCIKKLEELIKVQFLELQKNFLLSFLRLIEYLSHINEISINIGRKKQSDFKQINQQFLDQGYLNFNQHYKISQIFEQVLIDIKELQKKFSLCLSNVKSNNQNIEIKSQQINSMSIAVCSGKWIKVIREELIKSFRGKFNIFENEVKSIEDIQTIFINCIFCIQILKIMKQFYQVHEYKVKSFEQKINEEKRLEIQQQDQFNKDFMVMIIKSLTQEKENLAILLKQKQIQQNAKLCKEKSKQLLQQLNQDYKMIYNEYKQVSFQDIKDVKSNILTLISDAQFITLQNYNEAQDVDAQDVKAFKSLLLQYEQQIDEISRISNSYCQDGYSQEDRRTFQEQIKDRQYQDFCLSCVDLDFQQIKITHHQLILLEQLLTLNINQIQLNDEDATNQINNLIIKIRQLESKFKIQTQISNLINILNGSNKASNCQCVVQTPEEYGLENPKIKSTLQETLDIFLLKSNSQEKLQIKLDPQYVNVINNLCQQIVQKKSLFDVFDFNNDYKIRECFVYNLIQLQQGFKEEQLLQFSQKLIQYFWVFEKDQRVRNLLKNQELKEMQKTIFSKDIKSISDSIRYDMKLKMKNIERIQQEIKLEGNQQIKDQLKQQLLLAYEELDHYNDNINEMSEKMEISLIFLKDISKDIKSIKISIDEIQNSIQQVGDDIRKLKGKSYKELLEIRKQKILLQSKLTEVDSVYVSLKTIEYNPVTGNPVIDQETEEIVISDLMMYEQNNFNGEVNEFIWDESQQKDVMLLYGNAGSGKSKAAKKIEEFIWKQKGNFSKWTPIFVSLPTLKSPKYNLFEQALESENYQFDKYQIRDFKEAIQTKKEYIVLILDSYDEMKQDCIQSNLITTNKIIQDLNVESKDKQVKVIITTRKEILNTLGYQTWFYGESLQSLKEVKIEDFNKNQKDDYLFQYAELSVKRKLRPIFDFLKQISNQNFDLDEFLQMWSLIKNEVQKSVRNSQQIQLDSIFENSQVNELIKKLVDNSLFYQLKEEQITGLRKDLSSLWSVHKFEKAIQNVGIIDLLSTPFMLEIIVQVLPKMTKQQDGSVEIKNRFVQSYLNREKQLYLSQKLIDNYKIITDDQQVNAIIKKPIYDGKQQKFKIYQEFDLDKYESKIYDILEQLESVKFFQFYSITSILKIEDSTLLVDNNPIDINNRYEENLELILHALNMKKFTIFEFYDSFINFYHDQQIQKLRETGKISNWESFQADILQFSSNLALDMTVNQLSQITYQQKGKLKLTNNYNKQYNVDEWLDEYFDDSQQEHEYNKLIRSCILLNAKGSSYSFTHKSIQEFFTAKYILEVLFTHHSQRLNKNLLQIVEYNEQKQQKEYQQQKEEKVYKRLLESLYNQRKMNLSEDHYKGILSFIKDKLKSVDNINNTLIDIVQLSRNNKFMIGASNSMYLLSYLDIYLGHEDFSEIQLSNTDISGLSFFSSNFRQSKFNNVRINSCNFNLADLTDVEWEDIICKEKPSLRGHNQKVQLVQYSPNGQYIASVGEDGQAKIWNVDSYQPLLDKNDDKTKVCSIQFSQDNKIFATGDEAGRIMLWNIQNIENKQLITRLDYHQSPVTCLQFLSDGKKIISQDNSGRFINSYLENNQIKQDDVIFEFEQEIFVFTFSYDDSILAIGLKDSSIKLIFIETKNEENLIGHTGKLSALAFNKIGNNLVSACSNLLILWDLKQKYQLSVLSFLEYSIQYLMISNERELVIGSDNYIAYGEFQHDYSDNFFHVNDSNLVKLFQKSNFAFMVQEEILHIVDLSTLAVINSISFHDRIMNLQSFNDEALLEVSIGNYFKQKKIYQMNSQLEVINDDFKGDEQQLEQQDLVVQQDNNCILIYNKENQERYNLDNASKIFQAYSVENSLQINQQILALLEVKNQLLLYDLQGEKQIKIEIENQNQNENEEINVNEKLQNILKMVFQPCKPIIYILHNDSSLYTLNISKKPFQLKKCIDIVNLEQVNSMKFSLDGSLLFIHLQKNIFLILDENNQLITKEINSQIDPSLEIQVAYDNKVIAFKDYDNIKLWNLIENQQFNNFSYKPNSDNLISKFHPDKINLVLIDSDILMFFNINTGEQMLRFQLPNSEDKQEIYKSMCFSTDGNKLIIAGSIIRIWKIVDHKLEMVGAQKFDKIINQVLLYNDDQNLLFVIQGYQEWDYKQIIISPLSIFNVNAIFLTQFQFAQFLNGRQYMITHSSYEVQIFDFKSQRTQINLDVPLSEIIFFQDGIHCLTFQQKQILKINIQSKQEIFTYKFCEEIKQIKLIQNEQILVLKFNDIICFLNIQNNEKIYQFASLDNHRDQSFNNSLICYRTHSYSDFIIKEIKVQSNIRFLEIDKYIQDIHLFDYEQKKILINYSDFFGIFDIFSGKYYEKTLYNNQSLAVSNDETMMAYYGDYKLQLYDIKNDNILAQLSIGKLKTKQFSKKGDLLFCQYFNQDVVILEIENKKKMKIRRQFSFDKSIQNLTFSRQNNLIAFQSLKKIILQDLKWMLETVIFNFKINIGKDNVRQSFIISNNNLEMYVGQSEYLLIYQIDQMDQIYSPVKKKVQGVIQSLVEIDNENVCVSYNQTIQIINLNKDDGAPVLLEGHTSLIQTLCYSQKKQLLASSGRDQKIFLWNVNAKKIIAVLEGHTEIVNQVSFSPDGLTLASGSDDKFIKLWNIESSEQLKISRGHKNQVNLVVFSKDGLIMASCSRDFSIILWDLLDKAFIIKLNEHKDDVSCIDFSYSNEWLISGGSDQSICIWDIKIPNETKLHFKIEEQYLYMDYLCFSPKGQQFATISSQEIKNYYSKICFTKLQIWSMDQQFKKDKQYKIFNEIIDPFCISSDDQFLFQGYDSILKVYNLYTEQNIDLEEHQSKIQFLTYTFNQSIKLLSVDVKNNFIIWEQEQNIWKIVKKFVIESQFSAIEFICEYNCEYLLLMNQGSIIKTKIDLLNQSDVEINCNLQIPSFIYEVQLSNSQNLFAITSAACIKLLDAVSGEIKDNIQNQNNYQMLSISFDDKFLAAVVGSQEIQIYKLFQLDNREIIIISEEAQALQFSQNDSNILITASNQGLVKIWNIKNNSYEIKIDLEVSCQLKFSKLCNFIALQIDDNEIKIINIHDNSSVLLHQQQFNLLVFSNNERLLVTVIDDSTIQLCSVEEKNIYQTFILQRKHPKILLTFSLDDTQLFCCQQESIYIFTIQNDLTLKLNIYWQLQQCKFSLFCPKQYSIFQYDSYSSQLLKVMKKSYYNIFYDQQHEPKSFNSSLEHNILATINLEALILWNLESQEQLIKTNQWNGNRVLILGQCKRLIIGNGVQIQILDFQDVNMITQIQSIQLEEFTTSLSLSNSKNHLVCVLKYNIRVWEIRQDNQALFLKAIYIKESKDAFNAVLSSKGEFIVYTDQDSLKLIWIKQVQSQLFIDETLNNLEYTFDGKHLITLINGCPKLIDASTFQIIENNLAIKGGTILKLASKQSKLVIKSGNSVIIAKIIDQNQLVYIHEINKVDAISLAISPQGDYLVAGNRYGSIKLFDLTTYSLTASIEGQNDQVNDLAFNLNGTDIAAAIFDGSVNLYSIQCYKDSNNPNNNNKESQNYIQVEDQQQKQNRLVWYKSFSRQSLLLAYQCIIKNTKIEQKKKSIIELFKQKGAKE